MAGQGKHVERTVPPDGLDTVLQNAYLHPVSHASAAGKACSVCGAVGMLHCMARCNLRLALMSHILHTLKHSINCRRPAACRQSA